MEDWWIGALVDWWRLPESADGASFVMRSFGSLATLGYR